MKVHASKYTTEQASFAVELQDVVTIPNDKSVKFVDILKKAGQFPWTNFSETFFQVGQFDT